MPNRSLTPETETWRHRTPPLQMVTVAAFFSSGTSRQPAFWTPCSINNSPYGSPGDKKQVGPKLFSAECTIIRN